MKDFKEKLGAFKASDPIPLFYEFGMTPEDIKAGLIDGFSGYFQNQSNLHQYAITDLMNSWLAFLTLGRDYPDLVPSITSILNIFNSAKEVDAEQAIDAYYYWIPEMNQGVSRFWSLYNSQTDILSLGPEDFLAEAMRIIGLSIEGLSKPFLKLLLHLNRIKRNKPVNRAHIEALDLGAIIYELIDTTSLDDLLIIQPNNATLSQWRNIAYHHNSRVVGGKIFYSVKTNTSTAEYEISKEALFSTLKKILATYKVLRIAQTIFCIDNASQIQNIDSRAENTFSDIRDEARLVDFYASLSSQGFVAIDLKYDSASAKLDLRDVDEYANFPTRAIHASQFLYHLWNFTGSAQLDVTYFLFNGKKFFSCQIQATSFEKHAGTNVKFSELLEEIKYTFISTEFHQNKNPFAKLKLSDKIKKRSGQCTSQAGIKINTETFVEQFCLSVLCNYLALRSEGFSNIITTIGKDGCLTRIEEPNPMLFHIPATIKYKPLQIEIIKITNELMSLYEKGLLDKNLVDRAKKDNRFFHKKRLIKQQMSSKIAQ